MYFAYRFQIVIGTYNSYFSLSFFVSTIDKYLDENLQVKINDSIRRIN
jgi:hypothetical protein